MPTETARKAVKLFDIGYNCAESVLLAVSGRFNKKSPIIPRVATGFGAGVGRSGQICGALSGAVMAVGLLKGCDKGREEREKRNAAYESVRQMVEDFEEEFGSSQCRVLTQCDFATEEGKGKYRREELHEKLCPKFIGWCADYVANNAATQSNST